MQLLIKVRRNLRKKKIQKHNAAEKGPPVSPYDEHKVPSAYYMQVKKENATKQENNSPHTIEELYTAVEKKPKLCEPKGEPSPPHSVKELCTAVQKCSATKGEEEAPPIPPHTVEDSY